MKKTETKVMAMLKKLWHMPHLCETDRLLIDLGLDSLDMVTLFLELEDHFHITLGETDIDMMRLKTVADVIHLVAKYTEAPHEKEN